jgi:hypothetical protein
MLLEKLLGAVFQIREFKFVRVLLLIVEIIHESFYYLMEKHVRRFNGNT